MNKEAHRQQTLDWYVKLAQSPGWKEYVWSQVQDIAKQHSDMHADLPARLVAAMKALATTTNKS